MYKRFTIAALAALSLNGCYVANANVFADIDAKAKLIAPDRSREGLNPDGSKPGDIKIVDAPKRPNGWLTGRVNRMSGKTYADLVVWATKEDFVATTSVRPDSMFTFDHLPEAEKAYRVTVTDKSVTQLTFNSHKDPILPFRDGTTDEGPYVTGISTNGGQTLILIINAQLDVEYVQ